MFVQFLCQLPKFMALWPGISLPTSSTCRSYFQSLIAAAMPFGEPHYSASLIASPTFYQPESLPLLSRLPPLSSVAARFACKQYSTAAKPNARCAPFAIGSAAIFALNSMAKFEFVALIHALPCANSRRMSYRCKRFPPSASASAGTYCVSGLCCKAKERQI
jgi:hypothetical protein